MTKENAQYNPEKLEIYVRPVEEPMPAFDTHLRLNYRDCFIDFREGMIRISDLAGKVLYHQPVEKEHRPNTLTCVYCGAAFPEGTPPHGHQVLTDHIKVCEKHPLRKAEETIAKLQQENAILLERLR